MTRSTQDGSDAPVGAAEGCIAPSGLRRAGRARSSLETVSIAEVERDRLRIRSQCFTPDELDGIAGKRTQTLAGFLAVKRSLVALFSSVLPAVDFSEKDFVLSHRENGAPLLVSVPQPLRDECGRTATDVRISISHTRHWAYGLSVYREDDCV